MGVNVRQPPNDSLFLSLPFDRDERERHATRARFNCSPPAFTYFQLFTLYFNNIPIQKIL